jgi:dihydrofolate synthase/folylpolyglutamate synthase
VADKAVSDHPRVQAQLDRLVRGSLGRDVLGLDRIRELLVRVGRPELALPPIFHMAGTNGKGSTSAFLRSAIEASGLSTHVYTSPHLVRFNERFRIAGRLIDDEWLADLLDETVDAAGGRDITFFEATTVVAFLAFARAPADACIVEVGIGGRFDATNVIPNPAMCGIAQLGMDHSAYLGTTLAEIAGEKAGIAKPGVPLVTQQYDEAIADVVGRVAAAAGAPWGPGGRGGGAAGAPAKDI